jgi:signal transduction histidine kinase
LYSQEEIEVARAAAERLLDNQAGAEMGRRLITLQRQRLAESQVLDGRARRKLHDDVLPRLHAAMLAISTSLDQEDTEGAEALSLLGAVHRQLSEMLQEMPGAAEPLLERLGLAGALRAVSEHELAGAFDEVTWEVAPGAEGAARALPPLIAEVVFCAAREAMRNAARHARWLDRTRPLCLRISLGGEGELKLVVEDNGVGFAPAESTAGGNRGPVSGHGLALHSTMMAVIGGSLEVESARQEFTRVSLRLPVTGGQDSPLTLPAG